MSRFTIANDEVESFIEENGEPVRTKPHGGDFTVLIYDEESNDGQVRSGSSESEGGDSSAEGEGDGNGDASNGEGGRFDS